jgi:hypothetical protein
MTPTESQALRVGDRVLYSCRFGVITAARVARVESVEPLRVSFGSTFSGFVQTKRVKPSKLLRMVET